MSVSLPSKEFYVVDVPEVEGLTSTFVYNFFTKDESTSETGGVPDSALQRKAELIDSSFLQYATTRVPRMVTLSWKPTRFKQTKLTGNNPSDTSLRSAMVSNRFQKGSLIKDNLDKVMSEDKFASDNFTAFSFHDLDIDDKLHRFMSGSVTMKSSLTSTDISIDANIVKNVSVLKEKESSKLASLIRKDTVTKALSMPSRLNGVRFFSKEGSRKFNRQFRALKNVITNAQVNNKLLSDVVNNIASDHSSLSSADVRGVQKVARAKSTQARSNIRSLTESEFKTFVPYFELRSRKVYHPGAQSAELVGYIIDRIEVLSDGSSRELDPIVIDNPFVNFTADFKVRYGSSYTYSMRSVAAFTLPAIDDESGDVGLVSILVSSRPSNKTSVETVETSAPPVPSDLSFTWDYDRINPLTAEFDPQTGDIVPGSGQRGSLLVHWTFPPNSQRDIKKFQVFRRSSVDNPFELIKEYEFDDSDVQAQNLERPDSSVVELLSSPKTFVYDDEFVVGLPAVVPSTYGEKFIYAVVSVDAHGYSSPYSVQFEVWFDQFKNKLQKRLVSHSGAPKPYPNLYLEADAFVDTIRVAGNVGKTFKLYLNPEYYHVINDSNNVEQVLMTDHLGSKYRMQFINTDNQKSTGIDVIIKDITTRQEKKRKRRVQFGPVRRPPQRVR